MNIRKGDNIIMLSGKDRRKTGKVLYVFPSKGTVVVEGLNLVRRHTKPRQQGQKGQVVAVPRAVRASSVMLVCGKCNKPARVGYEIQDRKKVRVCKKCKLVT